MAILRASDIRNKEDTEIASDLAELRKNLMKIRGGLASGGIPEDVGKTREIKKTIARILTIKHERELGLSRISKKSTHEVKQETKPIKRAGKPEDAGDAKKQAKTTKKQSKAKKENQEVTKKK
ncbi:MAG: 50S ribosomal protein L29 [Candidatus Altiarchaeota archaeon]|nr:50S ribosomal protein L29 [Candidatus Altiarchaeota archaeon]